MEMITKKARTRFFGWVRRRQDAKRETDHRRHHRVVAGGTTWHRACKRAAMNETALITGCTRGIGLELAHEFARHGHPLILVAADANELARLSTERISAHGI